MDNYEQLVSRIAEASNIDKEELERKIEAKRAKLSGLVSKEGAAQIVAAELGVNLEKERLKISELVHGMKRANVVGKVIDLSPVRQFNKNGREGKVVSLLVADDTSNTRAVLWDTNHIALVESGEIKQGSVVAISNAGVRNGELHLSSFSDIKLSKEKMGSVISEKVYGEKKIKDGRVGESMKTRAVIVQVFEPRYFEVNAATGRKISEEEKKKGAKAVKRALLNIVLDDGSETMRCVLFGEQINKLGLSDEEIFSLDKFATKKQELLGSERLFAGNLRSNALYNTTELTIESVEEVNVENLVKELEAKA